MPIDTDAIKAILDFAGKAIASGVGAWAAFRFQEYRETRKERGDRLNALREALFVLTAQRNFLLELDRQLLDPVRQSPTRHLLLRPWLAGRTPLALDLSKLLFLIKLHKSGSLISELDTGEAQFQSAVTILKARGDLHNTMQERLDATKPTEDSIDSDTLTDVVGRRVLVSLKAQTDALYGAVSDALATNRASVVKIQGFVRLQFPRERVPTVTEDAPKSINPGVGTDAPKAP